MRISHLVLGMGLLLSESIAYASVMRYVGLQAGLQDTLFGTTGLLIAQQTTPPNLQQKAVVNSDRLYPHTTAFAGLGKMGSRFYYGLEATLSSGSGKASVVTQASGSTTDYKVTEHITHSYGLDGLAGLRLTSNNTAYLRAGWVRGHFRSKSDNAEGYLSGYSGRFSKSEAGYRLGAGLMSRFSLHGNIRFEYDYLRYHNFTQQSSATAWQSVSGSTTSSTATWTYRPRVHRVSIGVIYQF